MICRYSITCEIPRVTHVKSTLPPAIFGVARQQAQERSGCHETTAIQSVALDVHQATLAVSARDEQGSIVMRATVATEAKAIVALVRGLGSRVHIAFEEGTQAQWLHDVLTNHAERVIVCNTRGRGEIGNKRARWRGQSLDVIRSGGAGLSANRALSSDSLPLTVMSAFQTEMRRSCSRQQTGDSCHRETVPLARNRPCHRSPHAITTEPRRARAGERLH